MLVIRVLNEEKTTYAIHHMFHVWSVRASGVVITSHFFVVIYAILLELFPTLSPPGASKHAHTFRLLRTSRTCIFVILR